MRNCNKQSVWQIDAVFGEALASSARPVGGCGGTESGGSRGSWKLGLVKGFAKSDYVFFLSSIKSVLSAKAFCSTAGHTCHQSDKTWTSHTHTRRTGWHWWRGGRGWVCQCVCWEAWWMEAHRGRRTLCPLERFRTPFCLRRWGKNQPVMVLKWFKCAAAESICGCCCFHHSPRFFWRYNQKLLLLMLFFPFVWFYIPLRVLQG